MKMPFFRFWPWRSGPHQAAPQREVIDGYEHPELVEVVFRKTVAFRSSPADSPFREQFVGAQTVLDFGGACGLHYKKANDQRLRWAVVETPAMVKRASELATDRLNFFSTVEEAIDWLGQIDVMHSDGAIQYTEDPQATVNALCSIGATVMLWRRLTLSATTESRLQVTRLADNGPGTLPGVADKDITYRETPMEEATFIACHEGYRLTEREGGNFRFERAV